VKGDSVEKKRHVIKRNIGRVLSLSIAGKKG